MRMRETGPGTKSEQGLILVCTRMLPVCIRMSLVCQPCGVLVTIQLIKANLAKAYRLMELYIYLRLSYSPYM